MTRKEFAQEMCRWEDPDCEGIKCPKVCEVYKNYYERVDWIQERFCEKEKVRKIFNQMEGFERMKGSRLDMIIEDFRTILEGKDG